MQMMNAVGPALYASEHTVQLARGGHAENFGGQRMLMEFLNGGDVAELLQRQRFQYGSQVLLTRLVVEMMLTHI